MDFLNQGFRHWSQGIPQNVGGGQANIEICKVQKQANPNGGYRSVYVGRKIGVVHDAQIQQVILVLLHAR